MDEHVDWAEQIEDLSARYEDLLRRLESLAENGIFPQSRSAAFGILKEHREQFKETSHDHQAA